MYDKDLSEIIDRNRREYAEAYESMNWPTPQSARQAMARRQSLLNEIFTHPSGKAGWLFENTKPFIHDISPGCSLCGNGGWSCLFINNICNARCFYCPSTQADKSRPMTNALEFTHPGDYADYVRLFDIGGVSFSGGEPFMTFDRVLLFLKTLRSRISRPLYIWMYTNGILAAPDKLKALRDEGLDELRFDISAHNYRLDTLKSAVAVIPRVTVEIPAIPEDLEQTRALLPILQQEGVRHLNLHQIRCTHHNRPRLMERQYTFLHGPAVTILETELTALELILHALNKEIDLPINYCSFTYRHQFQKAAAMKRSARFIAAAHEDITAPGFIRTLSVHGAPERIQEVRQTLSARNVEPSLWQQTGPGSPLFFHPHLWSCIDFSGLCLTITYSRTAMKPSVSFRHAFKKVPLSRKRTVILERQAEEPAFRLENEDIRWFGNRYISPRDPSSTAADNGFHQDLPDSEKAERINAFECFRPGLSAYF